MGLPECETDISFLGATKHEGSVGNFASSRPGAGVEMRRLEEPTTNEADLGARVQQNEQISGCPVRQGHRVREDNLVAFDGVWNLFKLEGGILAKKFGQGCVENDRL